MIKLKKILTEEKEAFRLENEGKINYSVFDNGDMITITLLSNGENLGRITLNSNTDDLGDIQPKRGYMFIDFVEVKNKGEGFGFLLYKEALKYCQKNRYRGLVSGKDHRIQRTESIWNKITTSEDKYYSYADIIELGRKIHI